VFNAYRYRIYPTEDQKVLLAKHFGCARWIYNTGLKLKVDAWKTEKKLVNRYDIQKMIPAWKADPATSWLSEVNAQSLQSALVNLEMAFTRFFREKKGFPNFKSKHNRQSFQVPQRGRVGSDFIHIPKLLKVKARVSRPCRGVVKQMTISQTPTGKYFATVYCDDGKELPVKMPVTESGTVGIDMGLKTFAVLSTGEKIESPRKAKLMANKLARAQRRCSRCKIGSNNRNKARMKAARVYERVLNQRKDFTHKLTTRLVRDNQTDTFAIEDLAIDSMLKNKKLAFSIADASWGVFRRQLKYKAERAGKNVITIGRYEPSSKACSCGVLNNNLKLSDRVWTCSACGAVHDRDLNAARNIKLFALHPKNLVGQEMPKLNAC
jgi:putative transposase